MDGLSKFLKSAKGDKDKSGEKSGENKKEDAINKGMISSIPFDSRDS
jgi:hypothetical protein